MLSGPAVLEQRKGVIPEEVMGDGAVLLASVVRREQQVRFLYLR